MCVSWFCFVLFFSFRVIFSLINIRRDRSTRWRSHTFIRQPATQHAIVKQRFRFLTFDSLFMLLIRIPLEIFNSQKIVFRVCNFFRTTVTSLVALPPPSTYFLFIFFNPKKTHTAALVKLYAASVICNRHVIISSPEKKNCVYTQFFPHRLAVRPHTLVDLHFSVLGWREKQNLT